MLQDSKKGIIFALLLAFSCSYNINCGFSWKNRSKKNIFQRVKNSIREKFAWGKNKVVRHTTIGNASFAISLSYITILFATAVYFFDKKYERLPYGKAPNAVKNYVTNIAQKLKIKNPEKINIKISLGGQNLAGLRGIILSEATHTHQDISKYIIGHELSHYKHKDVLVNFLLKIPLFLLLTKYKLKILKLKDIPLFRKNKLNLSVKERLLALGFSIFVDVFVVFSLACRFILTHTIGKYFEVRADIESASLGEAFANGGIKYAKEQSLRAKKASLPSRLYTYLRSPHLPWSIRLRYLKWYKNWKYR